MCVCVYVCVIQSPSQLTHWCRGRAWTARKLDCLLTSVGDSSVSCWRRTATPWCLRASTPTVSPSSTWTTPRCRPRHQTLTPSSGTQSGPGSMCRVSECWPWGNCNVVTPRLQPQAKFISGLLRRREGGEGADVASAHEEDSRPEEKDPQVWGKVWRGAKIQGEK